MASMDADRLSICDYLTNNKFIIPDFQRRYEWSENECQQFYEDILDFYHSVKDIEPEDIDERYFLGTVVSYDKNKNKYLVDGQQRTTTFFLFLKVLLADKELKDAIEPAKQNIKRMMLGCLYPTSLNGEAIFSKPKLKSEILDENESEHLSNIFLDNPILSYKDNDAYSKNYQFFLNKIQNREGDFDLVVFCNVFLRFCEIISISCSDFDNAVKIFDTLNNRGKPLSKTNILKVKIYNQLDEQGRKYFAKRWARLEQLVEDVDMNKKFTMEELCKHIVVCLQAKYGSRDAAITTNKLVEFFTQEKMRIGNAKSNVICFGYQDGFFSSEKFNQNMSFLESLLQFWTEDFYLLLENETEKYYDILKTLRYKWEEIISVIFYTNYFKNNNDQQLLKKQLNQFLPYLCRLMSFPIVFNSKKQEVWLGLNASIYKHYPVIQMTDLDEMINSTPALTLEQFIKKSNSSSPISMTNKLTPHLILMVVDDENFEHWENSDIEHILPKKINDKSYLQSFKSEKEANDYKEHIGNKILLEKSLNRGLSNYEFSAKRARYNDSQFKTAKAIAQNTMWSKKQIDQRDREIYEKLLRFIKGEY